MNITCTHCQHKNEFDQYDPSPLYLHCENCNNIELDVKQDDIELHELPEDTHPVEDQPCEVCGLIDYHLTVSARVCRGCGNETLMGEYEKYEHHLQPFPSSTDFGHLMKKIHCPTYFKRPIRVKVQGKTKSLSPTIPYHEIEFNQSFKEIQQIVNTMPFSPEQKTAIIRDSQDLYVEILKKFRVQSEQDRLITKIRGTMKKHLIPLVLTIILPQHEAEMELKAILEACGCTKRQFMRMEKKISEYYPAIYTIYHSWSPATSGSRH
jgi:hypothetical protein